MYYESKRMFYIKQYGPKVFAIVLAFAIIGSGTYIYVVSSMSNSNPPSKEVIIASDSLVDESTIENNSKLPSSINELETLKRTPVCTVEDITSAGNVVVILDGEILKISLIGLDFTKADTNIGKILVEDLKGKEVTLAFDDKKIDKSGVHAYLYIEDKLYNQLLVEKGLVSVKEENQNTKYIKNFKEAQAYAKQNKIGIWKI